MAFSQKHIQDLFFTCKMDLQRTESLLGADRGRRRGGNDEGSNGSSGNTSETATANIISPQQASLHYQREAAAVLSAVAGKMERDASSSAAALSNSGAAQTTINGRSAALIGAAAFVRDSVPSKLLVASSPSSAENSDEGQRKQRLEAALSTPSDELAAAAASKLKCRLTKGLLKALDMPIDPPLNATVVNTSGADLHDDGFSHGGGTATLRQVVLSRVTDANLGALSAAAASAETVEAAIGGGGANASSNHSGAVAAAASPSAQTHGPTTGRPSPQPSLTDQLRFLPAADLSSLVARLWARVLARTLHGLFFTDVYGAALAVAGSVGAFTAAPPPADAASNDDEDNATSAPSPSANNSNNDSVRLGLLLTRITQSLLASEGCAAHLEAISAALYTTTTPTNASAKQQQPQKQHMVRTFHPNVFSACVEGAYLTLLAESTNELFLAGALSSSSSSSNNGLPPPLPPAAWARWYGGLLAVGAMPKGVLSLLLLGNDPSAAAGLGPSGARGGKGLLGGGATADGGVRKGGGGGVSTPLERYRTAVISPIVAAAKDLFVAIMAGEVPSSSSSSTRSAAISSSSATSSASADAQHISGGARALTTALAKVLSAHYCVYAPTATEDDEVLLDLLCAEEDKEDAVAVGGSSSSSSLPSGLGPAARRRLQQRRCERRSAVLRLPDALLREELVAPVVAALRAAAEEHKARVKSFGLPSGVLEAILSSSSPSAASAGGADDGNTNTRLPSRCVMSLLYAPLKAMLRPFLNDDDEEEAEGKANNGTAVNGDFPPLPRTFAQSHRETALTALYHLLAAAANIADDEEEAIASATRGAAASGDSNAQQQQQSGSAAANAATATAAVPPQRRLASASAGDVRYAIKKCFERRPHLVDRSAYDGVGGAAATSAGSPTGEGPSSSANSGGGGIVYKWNTDVFTAVVGELGLPLQPQGRRPLEEGGHELFRLTVPTPAGATAGSGDGEESTALVYHVFVDGGLLHAKELPCKMTTGAATAAQQKPAAACGGANRSLLLGGRPAGRMPMAAARPAMGGSASANANSSGGTSHGGAGAKFAVVESFEQFFGGGKRH